MIQVETKSALNLSMKSYSDLNVNTVCESTSEQRIIFHSLNNYSISENMQNKK